MHSCKFLSMAYSAPKVRSSGRLHNATLYHSARRDLRIKVCQWILPIKKNNIFATCTDYMFLGISVLKVFMDMFSNALQYHRIFPLKEHLVIALASSLTRKLFSRCVHRSIYCWYEINLKIGTPTSKFITTFFVWFIPDTWFYNKTLSLLPYTAFSQQNQQSISQ